MKRTMKAFYLSALLLLVNCSLFAQEFSKQFFINDTTRLYQGGVAVALDTNEFTSVVLSNDQVTDGILNQFYFHFIQSDTLGNLQQFIHVRMADTAYNIHPFNMIKLNNNTFLISATSRQKYGPSNSKPVLINMSETGNILWSKSLDVSCASGANNRLLQLSNGDILFVYQDFSHGFRPIYCLVDENGNFSNFNRFPWPSVMPRTLHLNDDGTFDLITSNGDLLNIEQDLSQINSNRKYFKQGGIFFHRLENGNYLIAIMQEFGGDPIFIMTDSQGTELWSKQIASTFGPVPINYTTFDFDFIEETADGNLLIGVHDMFAKRHNYLTIDMQGNLISSRIGNNVLSHAQHNGNDQMYIFNLGDFQTNNFILEKRKFNTFYPCDYEVENVVTDASAMEIQPDSASLFPVAAPTVIDINLNAQTVPNVVDFGTLCDFSTAGTQENEVLIDVYPNPTNGIVHIESSSKIVHIRVRNALGQEVSVSRDSHLDLSGLENGIYLLEITTNAGRSLHKLVKE
ncbi:T9SS type A sorting domain-containing protein [Lishizhenia sp.]|uniref:T9SS type A sorting domain-containing protein n=1 Tax=Lishizhenia sp. TaxID=2497594 RepID=UPI00299F051B|nr:T9SS type A sorting domain-containing protein [Lishizhenia sp.]MDX1447063.1 T9SS type A sorting domain-containing protein [Lishizhenia sp.]